MFSKESLVPACICQIFTTPHVIIKRHHIVQCWLKILCSNQRVSGRGSCMFLLLCIVMIFSKVTVLGNRYDIIHILSEKVYVHVTC